MTKEELINKYNVTGSNLSNIDQIMAMGGSPASQSNKVPPVTPVTTTPVVTPTTSPKTTTATPAIVNKAQLEQDIKKTLLTPDIGKKIANNEFVNAITKLKLGRNATADELSAIGTTPFSVGGASVSDVLKKFNASDLLPNYGIDTTVVEDKKIEEIPKVKSAAEKMMDLSAGYSDSLKKAKEEAGATYGLEEKSTAIKEAETIANDAKTALSNLGILQIKDQINLRDGLIERAEKGAVTMAVVNNEINKKLAEMTDTQKLDAMLMQNNLNNALVDVQIAQGNYDRAQELVTETANQFYDNFKTQLDILKMQGAIEKTEAQKLDEQAQYERELAVDGYVHIKSPSALAGLTEEEIFRDPVTGKIYRKPVTTPKLIRVNATKTQPGGYFNTVTGEFTPDVPGGTSVVTSGGRKTGGEITSIADTVNVPPSIDEFANNYLKDPKTLSQVPDKKREQVLDRAVQIRQEQVIANRPQTAQALQAIIQGAFEDGNSEQDIINGLVEDFGYNRDSATRIVNINKPQ